MLLSLKIALLILHNTQQKKIHLHKRVDGLLS